MMDSESGWIPIGPLAAAVGMPFLTEWAANRYRWNMYLASLALIGVTLLSAFTGLLGFLFGLEWLDAMGAFDWIPPEWSLSLTIALTCVVPALCISALVAGWPSWARILAATLATVFASCFWPAAIAETTPGSLGTLAAVAFSVLHAYRTGVIAKV